MSGDLSKMMISQRRLQEETYGRTPIRDMTDEERISEIVMNFVSCTDELHEALAEVGWKPWTSSKHVNIEAFRGELIDAFHFMMNLFLLAGMTGDEVEGRYFTKRAINVKRQESGYDGVSGKCPLCSRALDDPGVTCAQLTLHSGVCYGKDPEVGVGWSR